MRCSTRHHQVELLAVAIISESHPQVGHVCLVNIISIRPRLPVVLAYPMHLYLHIRKASHKASSPMALRSWHCHCLNQGCADYLSSIIAEQRRNCNVFFIYCWDHEIRKLKVVCFNSFYKNWAKQAQMSRKWEKLPLSKSSALPLSKLRVAKDKFTLLLTYLQCHWVIWQQRFAKIELCTPLVTMQ